MADAISQRDLMLVMTDANPCMVGSIIISKGKPVVAYSYNLTGRPRCTTTKNEMLSILARPFEVNPMSSSNTLF